MAKNEPGYVYILTNPSFREDWVKIGKTTNMEERLRTLYNTSLPLPFEVFATLKTAKYNEAERLVHRYIERFTNLRIEKKREFFNVKPEDALEIFKDVSLLLDDAEIDEVYKKTVAGSNDRECRRERRAEGENRVWMIPCNSKFFDLKGCFAKYGEMYWSQYFNYHKGDTGYIYMSSPDSAIIFSIEIIDADLTYSSDMDFKEEFFIDKSDFGSWKQHNRYARFRMTGQSRSSRLNLAHLMSHGLKMAPRGSLNLSHPDYVELKKYIEENF